MMYRFKKHAPPPALPRKPKHQRLTVYVSKLIQFFSMVELHFVVMPKSILKGILYVYYLKYNLYLFGNM